MIHAKVGDLYVSRNGDIVKLIEEGNDYDISYKWEIVDSKQFKPGVFYWTDCDGDYYTIGEKSGEQSDHDIICEFKGHFSKTLHIKNWKNPDSPDYMQVVEFDEEKATIEADYEELVTEEGGKKHDQGKPMFTCLPPDALLELGKVAELGARKYGLHNYRKGIAISRTLDAAFRHLLAAVRGEEVDSTDGNNHLASAAWNCLVALQTLKDHPELDDRYKEKS